MNINLKVSINSGMALILFLVSFALLLVGVAISPPIADNFVAAGTLLVGATGAFWAKRNANNKISLDAEKAGLMNGKSGDPLS